MSEDGKCCWGGLIKTVLAGAAIVAGVALVCNGSLDGLGQFLSGLGSSGASAAPSALPDIMKSISDLLPRVIGAIVAVTGANYIFSDGAGSSHNENSERHTENYREAKESFAMREDMRKMQTVMMARMKAAGQDPAMAAGPQMS